MRTLYIESGYRLVERAMRSPMVQAIRRGPTKWEWDISGNCERAVPRELTFRPSPDDKRHKGMHGMTVHLHARCRKCDTCMRRRQWMWQQRAMREVAASVRTWFGTITIGPQRRFECDSALRAKMAGQGIDFDTLCASDQFAQRVSHIGAEITRWMKRVRKETEASLRYIIVAEAHLDGWPHFHALIHQTGPAAVGERSLRLQWKYGFTKWKLVSAAEQAAYVCKYLSKAVLARVRASIRYGSEGVKALFSIGECNSAVKNPKPLLGEGENHNHTNQCGGVVRGVLPPNRALTSQDIPSDILRWFVPAQPPRGLINESSSETSARGSTDPGKRQQSEGSCNSISEAGQTGRRQAFF